MAAFFRAIEVPVLVLTSSCNDHSKISPINSWTSYETLCARILRVYPFKSQINEIFPNNYSNTVYICWLFLFCFLKELGCILFPKQ